MHEIPTFAVIGLPNDGKTTLAATLAEEDQAKIDPRAGTTTKREKYLFRLPGSDAPLLRFIDTPGFENTPQLRHWFEQHQSEKGNLALQFVAEHETVWIPPAPPPRYHAECEILLGIQEAVVLFVVDGSRAITTGDRDRVEILRLCSANRVAIINHAKSAELAQLNDWKDLLNRGGLPMKEFDAHHVGFEDRMNLLRYIATIMPDWEKSVNRSIVLLEEAWEGRLQDSRNEIMQFLEEAMSLVVHRNVTGNDVKAATARVTDDLKKGLRKRETALRESLRKLFRHSRTEFLLPEMNVLTEDLFSKRTWRLLGLDKSQLIWSSAAIGAVIGAGLDLMVAGASFMLGAGAGFAIGAVGGWLAADKSVEITTPPLYVGNVRLPSFMLQSNRTVQARIEPRSNLIWILIDRSIGYTHAVASWSHGRRVVAPVELDQPGNRLGIANGWNPQQRIPLIQWLGEVRKSGPHSKKALQARPAAEAFLKEQINKYLRK